MKPLICVTEKEYHKARDIFAVESEFECIPVPFEEDKLAAVISKKSAFGCILGVEKYQGPLYQAIGRGGIIARFGVGHDGVDKQKASRNGIFATNTPGVLDDSVAEHAVLLMGGFARHSAACHGQMKAQQWNPVIGSELHGKTLLVIGCGPIGRKTAKIAAFGFGMRVIGYDIGAVDAELLRRDFGIQSLCADLDAALAQADMVSLHIPSTSATRHFVNAVFLSKLKPTCVLINTARGAVVDESALYDVLKAGYIAGAALDVFENEPYLPVDSAKDLRTLENALLTPHIGSSTVEACRRMARRCLHNIKAAYAKQYDVLDLLNPEMLRP